MQKIGRVIIVALALMLGAAATQAQSSNLKAEPTAVPETFRSVVDTSRPPPPTIADLVLLLKSYAPDLAKIERLRAELEQPVPESGDPVDLARAWHVKARVAEELGDTERWLAALNQALAYSEKLLSDNKRQVEIGTLAPIEVVRAESEVASDQQKLIVAQTSLQQQTELIKTALAKKVDVELMSAQIETMDKLPEPRPDDIPPLEEALNLAAANRPEIEQTELKFRDQDYTIQARRNSLLPSLNLFATYIAQGLSGDQLLCPAGDTAYGGRCAVPGDGFVAPSGLSNGGVSQALTQTFQGHYPNYSFGVNLSIPIRNRSAQADMARALLERRQLETQFQQWKNNIAQQVRSAEIAVIQARAQNEAARRAVILAQQTLDAEQKKFKLGESTVFLVIQAQRDLATAEGNQVLAHSTYAKALTGFQQQTATILKKYGVEMSDAVSGHVERTPNIPGSAETPIPQKQ